MNREQRRKISAVNKISPDLVKAIDALGHKENHTPGFADGDKVKLNFERISKNPAYPRMNPAYKAWVNVHKDEALTVKCENGFYAMQEDKTSPKWLFAAEDSEGAEI